MRLHGDTKRTHLPRAIAPAETSEAKRAICLLEKDTGPCRSIVPRYFYNATADLCMLFDYGGCDGNGNNFNTMEECMTKCGKGSHIGNDDDDRPVADCHVTGCPPCHDCLPTKLKCPEGKPCPQYSCKNRCGPCEHCSDDYLCVDRTPRWCKYFKPCEARTCPKHPEAECFRVECDCFNTLYRLPNGTMLSWADCRRV
ncbi:tissue factor pathway inhibitor [Trichuris trichiura]|uniref:Tissue factor pathway inhibitor n=1 Tax=Trichuris trichiura TaxID=36087 RepID=A0A077ZA04_TRITR|nr:tissue factor pathway inhibitor [Trichuris trichiura]